MVSDLEKRLLSLAQENKPAPKNEDLTKRLLALAKRNKPVEPVAEVKPVRASSEINTDLTALESRANALREEQKTLNRNRLSLSANLAQGSIGGNMAQDEAVLAANTARQKQLEKELQELNAQRNELTNELNKARYGEYSALAANDDYAANSLVATAQNLTYDPNLWRTDAKAAKALITKTENDDKEAVVLDKNFSSYKYMTDAELANYNYLRNTQGDKAAKEYLNFIADYNEGEGGNLKYREGKARADQTFGTGEILGLAASSGFDRVSAGLQQLGQRDAVSKSSTQYASEILRGQLGTGMGVAYDLTETASNIAPSILVSMITKAPVLGTVMMGTTAGANAYTEKVREGFDPDKAKTYAMLIGASEAGLQYALGGISKLGRKMTGSDFGARIANIDNAFARVAAKVGYSSLAEGTEEGLQEILEPIFSSVVLDEEYTPAEVGDIAYSFLLGALMGGVFEGADIALTEPGVAKVGKEKRKEGSVESLIEIGMEAPEGSVNRKVAELLKARADKGKRIGNYQLGRLYEENKKTQERKELTDRLLALIGKELPTAEEELYGREDVSGESSKRLDGAGTGERIGELEGSAGRTAEESGQNAEQRAVAADRRSKSEVYELKSSVDILEEDGAADTYVRMIPEAEQDNELNEIADRVYKELGAKVRFFVGELQAVEGVAVDAVIMPDDSIYVRADSDGYTASQLAAHEEMHLRIKRNKQLLESGKELVRKELGEDLTATIKAYTDAYAGRSTSADYIMEEIICDAYAGVNKYGVKASKATKAVRSEVAAQTKPAKTDTDAGRAPPKQKTGREELAELNERLSKDEVSEEEYDAAYDAIMSRPDMADYENVERPQFSFSSIVASFFEDENLSVEEFEKLDYKMTKGYLAFVDTCLSNLRQTRPELSDGEARVEIERAVEGIVKVAVAMKKAGYDIIDYAERRGIRDSKGRMLFSALEPNSDYLTSFDISAICDKRKTFTEIYEAIEKKESELGVPEEKRFFRNIDNYFYIHEVMAKKGLTAPCKQCYVESMRKNMHNMAANFLELLSGEADDKRNPQLYHQKGKQAGEAKTNNQNLRQKVYEALQADEKDISYLTMDMLTSGEGLVQLKLTSPLVYEAFNSFYGQSKPKLTKEAVPYRFGELTALLTGHDGKINQRLVEQIKSTGGFRLQSYSDFQLENFADVLQVIFEAGTLGLPGHAYTKVPAFLEATKNTNLKRNISIFMYQDPESKEWKIDRADSFPAKLEEIYDIVKTDKSGNTGIVAVAQNKQMAAWIMANDKVGYGIPFHKSGNRMQVVRDTVVKEGGREIIGGYANIKDHTRQQSEVWKKTENGHKALTKVSKPINIYEFWDFDNAGNLSHNDLIKKNVEAYIDKCNAAGYIPKFREYIDSNAAVLKSVLEYAKNFGAVNSDATIEDISFEYGGYTIPYGYYKFLGDFSMFKPNGEASPVNVLSLADYNFDAAAEYFEKHASKMRRNELLQQFENGEVRDYYRSQDLSIDDLEGERVKRRDAAIEDILEKAGHRSKQGETKYSLSDSTGREQADKDYLDAVNRGDMETAQRMVDEAARGAGYTVDTYHGTDKDFTVFETLFRNEYGYHVGTKAAAESRNEYKLNAKVLRLYTKLGRTIQTTDVFGYFAGMHDYIFYVRGEMDKIDDQDFIKQLGRKKKLGNNFPDNEYLEQMHAAYVDFHTNGYRASDARRVVELTQKYLKSIGVDSVAYKNAYEAAGSTSYLLLYPNQVKSADPVTYDDAGNVIPLSKRFNQDNPDIRFSLTDRQPAPTFYSKLEREVDGMKQAKIGASSVIPYLKGRGVKDEEIKWSGVETFLEGKKSVSKDELLEYLQGNQIEIEEEVLGSRRVYNAEQEERVRRLWSNNERALEDISDLWLDMFGEELPADFTENENKFEWMSDSLAIRGELGTELGDILLDYASAIDENSSWMAQIDKEAEGGDVRWKQYSLNGGERYRELIFKMPGSDYINAAMTAHWEKPGVLAHARVQDMQSGAKKVLFIEELQSDWHNASNKKDAKDNVPDAPFRTTYHEFVLKRLLREAAENGYDYLAWTPGWMQEERWDSKFAEGYRIEYDQDIPKFLNKYGKQWGAEVEDILIGEDSGYTSWMMANGVEPNGELVHAIPITEAMRESVVYEGQPRFSFNGDREMNRNTMTRKAANKLDAVERGFSNSIAEVFSLPKTAQRDFLKPVVTEISDEYFNKGEVSADTLNTLFESVYDQGRVIDDSFLRENAHIKNYLRTVGIKINERDAADIPDWNNFRKKLWGSVLLKKGGIDVAKAYQELHEMNPSLFPEDITHPADQLQQMADVSRSIAATEYTLEEMYGDAGKEWLKNDFIAKAEAHVAKLANIRRYEDSRAASKEGANDYELTTEQALDLYVELKTARRNYEKVANRELLTEEDKHIVSRLLQGEITEDVARGLTSNAAAVIRVYRAKVPYEMLAKQLAAYKGTIRRKDRAAAEEALKNSTEWKEVAKIKMMRETPERVFEMVMGKDAAAMIREYLWPVHERNAASRDFVKRYKDRVRQLDLSRDIAEGNMVSEAHMVQLLGEAQHNVRYLESNMFAKERDGKTLEEWRAIISKLWAENAKMDAKKINEAITTFGLIYDELFQNMNAVRVENGYEPIAYRQGYFPHFQPNANDGILDAFGKVMGLNMDVASLPTQISGLTHTFRPGITYFNHAQQRLGFNTVYDAVEGFDKYIEGAANMIYQTRNIQKLRALENQIRYQTTTDGVRAKVDDIMARTDITGEEKSDLIEKEYQNAPYRLTTFVTWLREYTNLLAGKKSGLDREVEELVGRGVYEGMTTILRRVAGNMVAVNPGSWLTNIIPLTQASAVIDSKYILKAMDATSRRRRGDVLEDGQNSILENSVFLRNRRHDDPLVSIWEQSRDESETMRNVRKVAGKWEEKLSSPMEFIDFMVAEIIVRARYEQNVNNGLSHAEALEEADQMTARIMADRSKGSMPNIFGSKNPLVRLFTQFQLEVNNQLSFLFKDVPKEHREKGKLALAMSLMVMFLQGWLYNELYELLTGRRSALDPVEMLNELAGDITGYEIPSIAEAVKDVRNGENPFEVERKNAGEALGSLGKDVLEEVPFVGGLMGGGRLPISSALPKIGDVGQAISPWSDWSKEKRAYELGTELSKPLAYIAMPFGGGQLKKVLQGLNAVRKGGSYSVNTKGEEILQYPVFTDNALETTANIAKSVVFGKSSLPTAVEWVDSGFDSFSTKQTAMYQAMVDVGEKQHVAYEFLRDLEDIEKAADKRKFLLEADLSGDAKAIVYNSLATDKEKAVLENLADDSNMQSVVRTMINMRAEDKMLGKFKVLADEDFSEYEYLELMSGFMSEDSFEVIKKASSLGLNVEGYVKVRATIDAYDKNGNGSYSQSEIEDAIDALGGGALGLSALQGGNVRTMYLTLEERAILWQVLTGSKSASGNPYSVSAGQRYLNGKKLNSTIDELLQ